LQEAATPAGCNEEPAIAAITTLGPHLTAVRHTTAVFNFIELQFCHNRSAAFDFRNSAQPANTDKRHLTFSR
jgi:hypothetical protein